MPRIRLNREEMRLKDKFVQAVEIMMLDMSAEEVGRIADYVGEHGTDGDGGTREDGTVLECLRIIVDAMGMG
jgi:hypothetical protein